MCSMAIRTRWEIRMGSLRMDSMERSQTFTSSNAAARSPALSAATEWSDKNWAMAFSCGRCGTRIVVDPKASMGTGGSRDQKLTVWLVLAQGQQDIGSGLLRLFGDGKVI